MPQRWSITQLIWAPVGFAHRPAMWPEPWLAAAGSQEQETDLWLRPLVLPFHAPALACGTHGKSRAGTARVAVNCTSTSLSPWHGFIPFPLVLLEQGLAVGFVSWHDSPRWCLELQQWHQTLAGGC